MIIKKEGEKIVLDALSVHEDVMKILAYCEDREKYEENIKRLSRSVWYALKDAERNWIDIELEPGLYRYRAERDGIYLTLPRLNRTRKIWTLYRVECDGIYLTITPLKRNEESEENDHR